MDPNQIQLTLYRRILEGIASGESSRSTLDTLCGLVEDSVPSSTCSVMVIDPETGRLHFESAPCIPLDAQAELDGLEPGDLAGNCGVAVYRRETVITPDTSTAPHWAGARELAERLGIRSCWSVPILNDNEALGSLAISRSLPGSPDAKELELLETAGYLAGIALRVESTGKALLREKALVQSLLESAEDPIFGKDRNGRYLIANQAEAEGVCDTPEEMVGQTDFDFYPRDLCERGRRNDLKVMEEGKSLLVEETYENESKGRRTYMIRKSPLRDEQGRPVGIVGIARDVTEQKKAEVAMLQAQKLESLGVMAGGIAHDFNNLLTGILGNAGLGLEDTRPGSHVRHCFAEIQQASRLAMGLIDRLLAYAGRSEIAKRPVRLPELAADVRKLVSSTLSKKATLEFDVSPEVPGVQADPVQMRQVLMNLLTNASEALEDQPGTIVIRIHTVERDELPEMAGFEAPEGECTFVALEITDTGQGMDAETLGRIYDPFFTTKAFGRGLGLAAVRGIVRGHGGGIDVRSSSDGTSFRVFLPVCGDEISPAPVTPARHTEHTGRGETVLVVDDEDLVRDLARRALERHGFRVLEARDGKEALDRILADPKQIGLVLLDLTMPRMSGDEVVRHLLETCIELPVVLMSGVGESTLKQVASNGRNVEFLSKPFSTRNLVETVSRTLGHSSVCHD